MKGRIRIAAVGLVVMTVLTAVTSTAGATTTTSWNITGNGGFVSLDLLNALQLAGGGSEADASSSPLAEASGTGLCVDTSVTTNPCPTSATSSLTGDALQSTQDAVAKGNGVTATPTGQHGCTIPLNTGLVNVDVSCGTASASEDSSGNPTASGTGSLANVQVSLSLTSVLSSLLGTTLPSAGSLCGGVSAASTTGGASTGSGPLAGLIGTVNNVLGGLSLPGLNSATVDSSSTTAGACSLLGGLLNDVTGGANSPGLGILTGILNQLLGVTGGNGVGIAPLTVDLGGSTTAVSSSGNVVTDSVEQHAIDINLFGLADLQVAPTTAAVSLDRSSGVVTPSCNAGVLSYSVASGVQNFLQLGSLTQLVNNILAQLSSTLNGLTSALSGLIGELLAYNPTGNLLNCSVSPAGSTAHATVSVANAGLLTGIMGGIGLNVGDVTVSGSATTATPAAVTTSAATPAAPAAAPPAAAAPTAVPNVTTVHTGEFWSGSLPIILLVGMGLAGAILIGRRRIVDVARSINPLARRRGGQ